MPCSHFHLAIELPSDVVSLFGGGYISRMSCDFFALPQGRKRQKEAEKVKLARMANGKLLLGKKALAYTVEKVEKVLKGQKR